MPERAMVWLGLPFYERLIGGEMFRVLQEEEHRTVGEWRQFVCNLLGVPGSDRKRVSGALDGLLAAGVVLVGESTVRLLYGEESYRAAHGLPALIRDVWCEQRRATLPRSLILDRDGWACVYCGADLRLQEAHIDHVLPVAQGGSDEPENLVAACARCNLSKGARTPEEWRGAAEASAAASSDALSRRERDRIRQQRSRDRRRDVTRDSHTADCDVTRDGHGGGKGGSPSDLSSPSVSPSPLGSESTQEAGCNAPARAEEPNPARFKFELEELVRAEFFARSVTPQKTPASQWRDGCQTVADALHLGAYPDARAGMQAFAVALVDACAAGKPLGLALQQTPLGAKLRPPAPGGRQLSPLALATLARRAEGT